MPREIFIQLAVDYGEDPKVRALARYGKDARALRDLYVQMVCYAKKRKTDGNVPADEVGVLVYPDTPKNGLRDADRLCEYMAEDGTRLVERTETGYYITGFPKRNKSKVQIDKIIEEKRSAGELGNHNRWHVDGKTDRKCSICIANGSQSATG